MILPDYWKKYIEETSNYNAWYIDSDGETLTTSTNPTRSTHTLSYVVAISHSITFVITKVSWLKVYDKNNTLVYESATNASNLISAPVELSNELSPYTIQHNLSSSFNSGSNLQVKIQGIVIPPLFDGNFLPLESFVGEQKSTVSQLPDRWVDIINEDAGNRLVLSSDKKNIQFTTYKYSSNIIKFTPLADSPDARFYVRSKWNESFVLTDKDGTVLLSRSWGDADDYHNIPLLIENAPYTITSIQSNGANKTTYHGIYDLSFPYEFGDIVLPYIGYNYGTPYGQPSVVPFDSIFTTTNGTGLKNESGSVRYLFQKNDYVSKGTEKILLSDSLIERAVISYALNGDVQITDEKGYTETFNTTENDLNVHIMNGKMVFLSLSGDFVFMYRVPYVDSYLVLAVKIENNETIDFVGYHNDITPEHKGHYGELSILNKEIKTGKKVLGRDSILNPVTGRFFDVGYIQGTVKEQSVPVSKEVILFKNNGELLTSTRSDNLGNFQFDDVPLNWKYLIVSKAGHAINTPPEFHPDAVGYISPTAYKL